LAPCWPSPRRNTTFVCRGGPQALANNPNACSVILRLCPSATTYMCKGGAEGAGRHLGCADLHVCHVYSFSFIILPTNCAEVDLKALADAKMLKRMRILEEQVGWFFQCVLLPLGSQGEPTTMTCCSSFSRSKLHSHATPAARSAAAHAAAKPSLHAAPASQSQPQGARFAGMCSKDLRSSATSAGSYNCSSPFPLPTTGRALCRQVHQGPAQPGQLLIMTIHNPSAAPNHRARTLRASASRTCAA